MDDLVLVTRGRPPETGSWMDEVGLGGISARGLDSIEGFKGFIIIMSILFNSGLSSVLLLLFYTPPSVDYINQL